MCIRDRPSGAVPTGVQPLGESVIALRVTGAIPASTSAGLAFRAPAGLEASVEVFDLRGRLVRGLYAGELRTAEMPLVWDLRDARGHDVASGVYLVRARAGAEAVSLKLAVMR